MVKEYDIRADVARQRALARRISAAWHYTFHEIPGKFAEMDYLAESPLGWSVWDMKCRRYPSTMRTVLLDVHKVAALVGAGHALGGIPAYVAFEFGDGQARVLELRRQRPVRIEIGGRRDRNDPADRDPVAHYMTDEMVVIP